VNADLDLLCQRYLDGGIDVEGMARLNAILEADADARRRFAEQLNLDSALATQAMGGSAEPTATLRPRAAARWRSEWAAALVSAAAACLALAIWIFDSRDFARVEKVAGIQDLAPGSHLRGERRELPGGTLALVTAKGARVVIEAPAVFQFESAQRLRLTRGRLSADVPPAAKGFTVITPSGVAVDLGTRFGVDVPATGDAEVHVFEGEVIAHTPHDRRSLRTGDAVAMSTGGHAERDVRSAAFIQSDEVSDLTAGLAAGQRARSDAALAQLRNDVALIALLDFETGGEAGAFRTVQGRWPGSRAPEFVEAGDHLKLDLGGDRSWPRLTLAAWVRLDRLDAPYQSLLHTDGWAASNPGQVHWMVNRFSTMRLALKGNTLAPGSPEPDSFPDSRTPVFPEIGRWVHLAVVYDSEAWTTRFFLNGRFDSESRESIVHPARLGPAQIGNWNRTDRKLSGRVDELLVLGRAMSDDEIQALFNAGNPYQ
jgi:ferric-dicitrate binding protein FerR (iron transport regulator)